MTGLLLHSVDEKPGLFNMSRYPKKQFTIFLNYLTRNSVETMTVCQHASASVRTSPAPVSTTYGLAAPPSKQKTAVTFDDGLLNFYDSAFPALEERNVKSTVFAVAGFVGKTGGWDVMGKTTHMTAAMLREIAAKGHEIGSHSLTHANLVWLDDRELLKELRGSKAILENIVGTAVKSLSFPFGSWNSRVWNAAKSVGYEYATAYRGRRRAPPEIMPVLGAYRFDSAADLIERALPPSPPTISSSCAKITALTMSHFAKGTPIVKFRREYVRFPWG